MAIAQTWQPMSNFPGISRDDAVAEVINDNMYYGTGFGTGFVMLNDWWQYSFSNGTWTQLISLPAAPRQYAASCSYENKIFIVGGILNSGLTTNEVWTFDLEKKEWSLETNFPGGGRQAPVLLCLYNQLYCGLGRNDTVYYNDWWKYDVYEHTWEQLPNLPFNARYDAEGIETAGKAFVGLGKDTVQCYTDWWEFNPISNEWNQKNNFPGLSCTYTAGTVAGEQVIVYGGTDFANVFSDECFAYNAASNTWSLLPVIPGLPRKGGAAVAYSDSYYYVSGIDSVFYRTPEIWQLSVNTLMLNDILVYPNPTGDWICTAIQFDYNKEYLLEIYSIMNGQVSYAATINYFKSCFFVEDLAAGFYMARLRYGDNNFYSFRFLKE